MSDSDNDDFTYTQDDDSQRGTNLLLGVVGAGATFGTLMYGGYTMVSGQAGGARALSARVGLQGATLATLGLFAVYTSLQKNKSR